MQSRSSEENTPVSATAEAQQQFITKTKPQRLLLDEQELNTIVYRQTDAEDDDDNKHNAEFAEQRQALIATGRLASPSAAAGEREDIRLVDPDAEFLLYEAYKGAIKDVFGMNLEMATNNGDVEPTATRGVEYNRRADLKRSFWYRNQFPIIIFLIQAAFIVLFGIFVTYGPDGVSFDAET